MITAALPLILAGTLVPLLALCNETWIDGVKRGPLVIEARGIGVLTGQNFAVLVIYASEANEVRTDQMVELNTQSWQTLHGRIRSIGSQDQQQRLRVTVKLDHPADLPRGTTVDGTISIKHLRDVLYVGRPVGAFENSDMAAYKLEADGRHASKAKVHFGHSSVNTIEVVAGLRVGDQILLTDMRDQPDRITIK